MGPDGRTITANAESSSYSTIKAESSSSSNGARNVSTGGKNNIPGDEQQASLPSSSSSAGTLPRPTPPEARPTAEEPASGRGGRPTVTFRNLLSSPEFRSRLTPDQLASLTELLRVLTGEVVSTRQENAALKQSLTNALEHVMKLGQQRGGGAVGGAGEIAGRPLDVLSRENERFRDGGLVDGRGHSSGRDGFGLGSFSDQNGGPVLAANSYPDDPAAAAEWEETRGVSPAAGPRGSFFEEEGEPGESFEDSGSLRDTPASLPSDYGDFAADLLPTTLASSDAPLGSGIVSNGTRVESSVDLSDSGDHVLNKLDPPVLQPYPKKILVAYHVPMSFARPSEPTAPRAPTAVECCCDLSELRATSHWEEIHTNADFAAGVDESGGSIFRERMMQILFSTMVGALKRGIVRSTCMLTHDLSDLSSPQVVLSLRSELFWPMVAGFTERFLLDSTLLQYCRVLWGVTRYRVGYGWGRGGGASSAPCSEATAPECGCRNCSQCLFQRKAALLWDSPGVDGRPLGVLSEGPMSSDAFHLMGASFPDELPYEVAPEASLGRGAAAGGGDHPPSQSGRSSRAAVGPVRRAGGKISGKNPKVEESVGAVVPENTEFPPRPSARRRDSTSSGEKNSQYLYTETAFFRTTSWYPQWNQPFQEEDGSAKSVKQFFQAEKTFVDRKLEISRSLGEPMVVMRQWFKRVDKKKVGAATPGARKVPLGLSITKRSAILVRAGVICAFLAVLLLYGFGKRNDASGPHYDVNLSGDL